jgi:pyruvate-formate lyase-activating enzyme
MRPVVARPDGELEVLGGFRPAASSGGRVIGLDVADLVPIPEGTTLMHLPGRRALALDAKDRPVDVEADLLPVAAVLPVGFLRTLLPASRPLPGSRRLPLYGYAAVVEHHDELRVAALNTDAFGWWEPARYAGSGLTEGIDAARLALPGNRLVDHLAICATDLRCYTAQNTFLRRYEGALPASPACNADCLGCISLQTDGQAPAPQPRMRFAPTAAELAGMAAFHLGGDDAGIVSFGQGCEGEPLTRDDVLADAVAEIRVAHPDATIHVNTNGSRPRTLQRLIDAGCNSVRISAISFHDPIFRAYYRPVGYSIEDVIECGRVMSRAGGQVCVNLLTFPGVTDSSAELERTAAAVVEMGARQIQWRSLNCDHDWLVDVLAGRGLLPEDGIGLAAAYRQLVDRLPGVSHGNFTRPVGAAVD